ncbi:MAG: hypothetical protein Q9209_002389 [Squamulea sp. 1 TL-2023]
MHDPCTIPLEAPAGGLAYTAENSQRLSPFLGLPLELRRMIYQEAIPKPTRQPTSNEFQAIYFENVQDSWGADFWTVRPSPLCLLNKQIHAEFSDTMQDREVSIAVTGQGVALDETGLSASIAQKVHRISAEWFIYA